MIAFTMDVDFEVETAVQSGIDNTQNPEEEQQQQQQHATAESATLPGIGSRKRRKQFDHVRLGTLTKFLCIDEEAMEEYSKGKENFRAKRRAEAESMIWLVDAFVTFVHAAYIRAPRAQQEDDKLPKFNSFTIRCA